MARLIQKTGFISRKSAGGYMKYIATREGVEVLTGKGPATEKQKEIVSKLLKDFPDVRDSFEYEDYKQAPTLHNASAFISAALDSHMQNLQSENGYLRYIATRPGAEKHGTHGLFGREDNANLNAAMHDLTAHDGNVWTIIYSIHREDAERLGYNNAAAWRKLLVSQQNKFAEAFHIPASALHWYAAYHDADTHPHIHMMIWTDQETVLKRDAVVKLRSAMTNSIFQAELENLYIRKDAAYKDVTEAARTAMHGLVDRLESIENPPESIQQKMLELALELRTVGGKKQYGYGRAFAGARCADAAPCARTERLERRSSERTARGTCTMPESVTPLIAVGVVAVLFILLVSLLSNNDSLNGIKSKTVGDGQHGTARWATAQEIRKSYASVPFDAPSWRTGKNLPEVQGLILGSAQRGKQLEALVDSDDVHCLMIGASGVGKTAFFLYPNLEFACASGMSYVAFDTKGDLARNYGTIAKKYYGYHVSVVDLRNPTRSDGSNLLTLINRYMDIAKEQPDNLAARAKAEKYAKILAKTIVNPGGDEQDRGQNAYFYDAAEGLLTSVILLLAEYVPPDAAGHEKRHIVSVFKLVQELLAPVGNTKRTGFQILMDILPPTHKAKWFAGSAVNTSEQGMASVMSTVLSRLNAFLDSELEQVLCFDSAIDAEHFAAEKSAIFLVLPEEDNTKNFMAGLMIQNLSRELFSVADEHGGKLPNRVVFYCDELGTMPPFDILPLFSAGRSRKLTLVPIIQSLAQLEKNYGKEGAEIIGDNCQDTIFGGFAPNSQTAETLSKALGSRTVLTGSVSKGKDSTSRSLQMAERALLSPDELKNLPKGDFIVMKTGTHPMRTKLQLYFKWGISFEEPYQVPERAQREVYYAGKEELLMNIQKSLAAQQAPVKTAKGDYMSSYEGA